jgi:predicted DNA-binding transcriptional regulator AlpA
MSSNSDALVSSQSQEPIAPELLTTKQAAELLNIGERTLWRWSRCGLSPPPNKIGIGPRPAVRYRKSDLTEWIEAGCPRIDSTKR